MLNMDSSQYFREIIGGRRENIFPELTGPVIRSLEEAIESCLKYYHDHQVSAHVLDVRTRIGKQMEAFHRKAGTYSDRIKKSIKDVSKPETLVVEVAHQPNIFPYSGFFKKIVLGHIIAETIREKVDFPVVELFGIVDQDFANPKWFRNTYLPDINAKEGLLVLSAPVSRKSIDAMYTIEKPSMELVNKWKSALETWLINNARILNRLSKDIHGNIQLDRDKMSIFRSRLKKLFELIDDCAKISNSLTEFNSFFLSKLVNTIWDYPMVFYEYHVTQQYFKDEYEFLIKNFVVYDQQFRFYYNFIVSKGISLNFKEPERNCAPFWLHCDCGAKVNVDADCNQLKGIILIKQECPKCKKESAAIALDDIMNKISPRAVSRPIIVSRGIQPSIFISGLDAAGFELISRGIANDLNINLPPYAIWHVKDNYMGIAQAVANLTIKKAFFRKEGFTKENKENKKDYKTEMKEKKKSLVLSRCENALKVMPSIIDYLINFGFVETRDLWSDYLLREGGLSADLNFETDIKGE